MSAIAIQLSLFTDAELEPSALDAVLDHLKPYVLRGDTLDFIRRGQGGVWCSEYHLQIGGYHNEKRYPTSKILVTALKGKECLHIFDLEEIYYKIKRGEL